MSDDIFRQKTPFTLDGTVRPIGDYDPIQSDVVNKSISDIQALLDDHHAAWEATKMYGVPRYEDDADAFEQYRVVEINPVTSRVASYAGATSKVCALTLEDFFEENYTSENPASDCHRYQRVVFNSIYICVDPLKVDPLAAATDLTDLGWADKDLLSYETDTGYLVLASQSSNTIVARVIDASNNVIQFFGKSLVNLPACNENLVKNSSFEKVQDMTSAQDGTYLEREIRVFDRTLGMADDKQERGQLTEDDLLVYDPNGAPVGSCQPFPWLIYARNYQSDKFTDLQYVFNDDPADPNSEQQFIFHRNMSIKITHPRDDAFIPPFGIGYSATHQTAIVKTWNPFDQTSGRDANILGRNAVFPAQDNFPTTASFIVKVGLPYLADLPLGSFPADPDGTRRVDSDTLDVYERILGVWTLIPAFSATTKVVITYSYGIKETLTGEPFTGSDSIEFGADFLDAIRRAGGWQALSLTFNAPQGAWILPNLETFVEPSDEMDLYVGGVKVECGSRYSGYIEWQDEICEHFLNKLDVLGPFCDPPCLPEATGITLIGPDEQTIDGDLRHTMFQNITGGINPHSILDDLREQNQFYISLFNNAFGGLADDDNPKPLYYVVQDPDGRRINAPISGPLGQGSIEMEAGEAASTNHHYYTESTVYGTRSPFIYSLGSVTNATTSQSFAAGGDTFNTGRGSVVLPADTADEATVNEQIDGSRGMSPFWDSAGYPYSIKLFYNQTEDFAEFQLPAYPLLVKNASIGVVMDAPTGTEAGPNYFPQQWNIANKALFKSTADSKVYRIALISMDSSNFGGFINLDNGKGRIYFDAPDHDDVDIDGVDGTSAFGGTFTGGFVVRNSVSITWKESTITKTATDDGNGNLVGDVGAGPNTINYDTGVFSATTVGTIDADGVDTNVDVRASAKRLEASDAWTQDSPADLFPAIGTAGTKTVNPGAMPTTFMRVRDDYKGSIFDMVETRPRHSGFHSSVIDMTDATSLNIDGVDGTTSFSGTLTAPVTKFSFSALFSDGNGAQAAFDDGLGNLTDSDLTSPGSGTINYATGYFEYTVGTGTIVNDSQGANIDVAVTGATVLVSDIDDGTYFDYFDRWEKDPQGKGKTPAGVDADSGDELGYWLSAYLEFCSHDPNTTAPADVDINGVDGTNAFAGSFGTTVVPGTIAISWEEDAGTARIASDDGDGGLSDPGGGSGTINYITGAFSYTIGGVAIDDDGIDTNVDVRASSAFNSTIILDSAGMGGQAHPSNTNGYFGLNILNPAAGDATDWTTQGGGMLPSVHINGVNGTMAFSGSLVGRVEPGTFSAVWEEGAAAKSAGDDGAGNLTGDATGTIAYSTGAFSATTVANIDDDSQGVGVDVTVTASGVSHQSPAEYVDEIGNATFRFDRHPNMYYRRRELDAAYTRGFIEDDPSAQSVSGLFPSGAFPLFHKRWIEEDGTNYLRKAVRAAQVGDIVAANPLNAGALGGTYNLVGGIGGTLNWDITGVGTNNMVIDAGTLDANDILVHIEEVEFVGNGSDTEFSLAHEDVSVLEVVSSAALGTSLKSDLDLVVQRPGFGDLLIFSTAPAANFIVVYTTHRNHDWIDDEYYIDDRASAFPAGPNTGVTATTASARFDKDNSWVNLWTGAVQETWLPRGAGNRVILDWTDARHGHGKLTDAYTGASGSSMTGVSFRYNNRSELAGIDATTVRHSSWGAQKDSFDFDYCTTLVNEPIDTTRAETKTRSMAPLSHWGLTVDDHPVVVNQPLIDGILPGQPGGGTPTGKYFSGDTVFSAETLKGAGTAGNNASSDIAIYPDGGMVYVESLQDGTVGGGAEEWGERDIEHAQLMSRQKAMGQHVTYQLSCDTSPEGLGSREFCLYYYWTSAPAGDCSSGDFSVFCDVSGTGLTAVPVRVSRTLAFTLPDLDTAGPLDGTGGAIVPLYTPTMIAEEDALLVTYLGTTSNNHHVFGVKLDPPAALSADGGRKNPIAFGSVRIYSDFQGGGFELIASDRQSDAATSNVDLTPASWIDGSQAADIDFFPMSAQGTSITRGQASLLPVDVNDDDNGENPFGIGIVRYEAGGQYLMFTLQDAGTEINPAFHSKSARTPGSGVAETLDFNTTTSINFQISYDYIEPVDVPLSAEQLSAIDVGDHLLVNPYAGGLMGNSIGAVAANFRTETLPDSVFSGVAYETAYPPNTASSSVAVVVRWTESSVAKSASMLMENNNFRQIRSLRRNESPNDVVGVVNSCDGTINFIPSTVVADPGSGSVEYYIYPKGEFVEVIDKDEVGGTVRVARAAHPTCQIVSTAALYFTHYPRRHQVDSSDATLSANLIGSNFNPNGMDAVLVKKVKYTVLDPASDYEYLSPGPGGGEELNVAPYIMGDAASPPEAGTAVNGDLDGGITLFDLDPATTGTEYDTDADATDAQLFDLASVYSNKDHVWVMGLDTGSGGTFRLRLAEVTVPAGSLLISRDLSHDTESKFGGTLSIPPTQGDGGQISKYSTTSASVGFRMEGVEATLTGSAKASIKVYRDTGGVWSDVTASLPGGGSGLISVDNTDSVVQYQTIDQVIDLTAGLIASAVNEVKVDLFVDSDFRSDDDGSPTSNGPVGSVYLTVDLSVPAAPLVATAEVAEYDDPAAPDRPVFQP